MEELKGVTETMFATRIKRLFSFIIDALLIGLVGYTSGFIFEKYYTLLGSYGNLIGFTITLIYFSLFDSKLFNGQTIGKKILKIKVVNQHNKAITVKRSVFRSLFYSLTVLLNGLSFPNYKYLPVIIFVGIILFSIYLVETYLFIFNKDTKQTLHDFLSKTYVVDQDSNNIIDVISNKNVFRFAIIIPIIISILVIGLNLIIRNTSVNEMVYLVDDLQNQLPLWNTTINRSVTKYSGSSSNNESRYIQINCNKINKNDNSEDLSVKIAEIVLQSNFEFKDGESLIIVVNSGYDIGIARKNTYQSYNKSLVDWDKKIKNKF